MSYALGKAQVTVFSDDFSTNTNAAWTTGGAIGASAWTVTRSGDDWGARRNTSPLQLECTNDVGGTANAVGWVMVSTPGTSFLSPYNTTLANNGMVTWTFNYRQIQPDPGGFNSGSYGVAFILAGESTDGTVGNGYAVVLGQSGSIDSVRLISFTAGVQGNTTQTNIIKSNTAGLSDLGNEYLSVKVTYNPCNNNQWELFLRNDGNTAFADPLSGSLTSQGTASNSTFTGIPLNVMAAYWQGSTAANRTAFFDNVTVSAIAKANVLLGTDPHVCQGNTTGSLNYIAQGSPDQYSIDYSAGANGVGFVDITNAALPSSPISIVVPAGAPLGNYSAMLTVRNSTTGCVSPVRNFIVHVINCTAPYMTWVPLPPGNMQGSCTSNTNCNPSMGNPIVCYGLLYIPGVTGNVTSYTAGFLMDCSSDGNPIVSNTTCRPATNNSPFEDGCAEFGLVQFFSSANGVTMTHVTQNTPIILHQLCLSIPPGEDLNISLFVANPTISVDLDGGGFVTEFAGYTDYTVSSDLECVGLNLLPLRWLDFQVKRSGELISQLDWTTAEETNVSHFEIQRSNDSGRNFQTIGRVEATSRNETTNNYEFIDPKAMTGANFYRIKQVDFDGRYSYSVIRTISFTSVSFNVKAWPNPSFGELTVAIDHADDAGEIILVDLTGKQVMHKAFEQGASNHEFLVEDLQPGMYTLVVISGDKRYVEKVVIME